MTPPNSGKAFSTAGVRQRVYLLLNSINLVVFQQMQPPGAPMPKVFQFASYAALAAALILSFMVTTHAGTFF